MGSWLASALLLCWFVVVLCLRPPLLMNTKLLDLVLLGLNNCCAKRQPLFWPWLSCFGELTVSVVVDKMHNFHPNNLFLLKF